MSTRPRTTICLAMAGVLVVLATAVFAADDYYRNVLRVRPNDPTAASPETPPLSTPLAPASPQTVPSEQQPATPGASNGTLEDSERRLEEALDGGTEARFRDPTQPSEEMRQLVDPLRMEQPGGGGGPALPRVILRGRIIGPTQVPAAMIEIEQALYVIESGTEITAPTPKVGLGSVTLRVTELTAQQVCIEVMPLRQVLILR